MSWQSILELLIYFSLGQSGGPTDIVIPTATLLTWLTKYKYRQKRCHPTCLHVDSKVDAEKAGAYFTQGAVTYDLYMLATGKS